MIRVKLENALSELISAQNEAFKGLSKPFAEPGQVCELPMCYAATGSAIQAVRYAITVLEILEDEKGNKNKDS